ncbi:helix-turn-helix domain-containing protein [Micromonospora sp. WMMD723]|uniref:helix-turn-helix domain-containing protein n=1 Tax=Micromonospora sp. WMMD723 TaxID=3403465 RepID=UPI003CEFAC9D
MQVDNTLSGTSTGGLRDSVVVAVRVEMARQRMSQTKLAELTGFTQAYISRRMTGETPFDVVDLERIAGALNVPPSAFFPAPVAA